MTDLENIELISELITGRVKPHIYAFTTNTIPNYLKVGDTYRALTVRLNEWRKHFPNLQQVYSNPASIDDEIFFRDYAVHDFLIHEKGKYRLLIEDMVGFPPGTYYSKEFFKDTTKADVEEAIIDIQTSYKNNDNKYQFYNANTALPETYTYASTGYWTPRPNQQEAIDNFINAVDNGRTNLLMYAVMRFGKSFTAMCCAKAKNFKKVLVVSAKADVREEWKKTVQSADNFNQDYVFLSSEELLRDENIVSDTLASEKGIVLFLTLQDLQGTEIKTKHKSVFENELDLLIIDETHYGARAESYGRIIKTANTVKDITLNLSDDGDDSVDANIVDEQIKELNVRIKLHLSGTPYRILMGSEFSQEDIISFCQFSDIVAEQELWDKQHISYEDDKYIEEDEDKYQEYMPYANNIGTELNDDNQNTFIGEPGSCCTETFLSVGHTLGLSETTAKNLSNYMRTKFARFLLSLAKISQHGTSKTYRFVPIVDFNEKWTDEKLYKKFGLSQEEINCIETSIKPM